MTDKDTAMVIAEGLTKHCDIRPYTTVWKQSLNEHVADIIRPLLPKPVEVAESDDELANEIAVSFKVGDWDNEHRNVVIWNHAGLIRTIAAYRESIERKCGGKE